MSPGIQALYVHVPFCRTLCGYCDFYSVTAEPGRAGPLVDALIRELAELREKHELRSDTIFVGGGTPTVLPPDDLFRLLSRLRETVPAGEAPEFTVEANPTTVTPEIAEALASAGVNRVSIGAQSFEPAELRVLERNHQPPQVAETVEQCRRAGLKRISLDLIFAIPGQTLATWDASLRAAIALDPEHVSCYALTFEPGTRLFDQLERGEIERVDQDLDADMYECALDTLAGAGFEHYEISNFALPGRRCRHNLTYWRNEAYLGVGPSAAGFVEGVRYKNVADVDEYVRRISSGESPHADEEQRTPDERARESAMLELRMIEGIDRRRFSDRYGTDPVDFFREAVGLHASHNLLEITPTHLQLTRAGLLLADTVIADFL